MLSGKYIDFLAAGQLNDMDLQNQTLSATVQDINARYAELERLLHTNRAETEKLQVSHRI